MSDENKCVTCDHVHGKEDGTCSECGCQEGKKAESVESTETTEATEPAPQA